MTSAILCEHANESPSTCSCQRDCYCYVEGNCKNRKQFSKKYAFMHYEWDATDLVMLEANHWNDVPEALAAWLYQREGLNWAQATANNRQDDAHYRVFEISDSRKINLSAEAQKIVNEHNLQKQSEKEQKERKLLKQLQEKYKD